MDQQEVTALARKKAAFIVATNILVKQRLAHEQVIWTYKEVFTDFLHISANLLIYIAYNGIGAGSRALLPSAT